MLVVIFLSTVFMALPIEHTEAIKTTTPVSIILNGFTLQTWNESSLWNRTRLVIVRHLNELCRKDFHCDAEYGIANVHLINAVQYGLSSIRLNISADQPILTMNNTLGSDSSIYNYTALLIGALFQAKIDLEHSHENRSWNSLFSSSTNLNQTVVIHQSNRFLFVLLGIGLVALIFGLTVLFFQRIRRHNYSKLLKNARTYQAPTEESFTRSASISALQ